MSQTSKKMPLETMQRLSEILDSTEDRQLQIEIQRLRQLQQVTSLVDQAIRYAGTDVFITCRYCQCVTDMTKSCDRCGRKQ